MDKVSICRAVRTRWRATAVALVLLVATTHPLLANEDLELGFGIASGLLPLLIKPKKPPLPASPVIDVPLDPGVAKPARVARPQKAKSDQVSRRFARPPRGETRFVPKEVLVETRADATPAVLAAIGRRNRLELAQSGTFTLLGSAVHRYRFRDGRSVSAVIDRLAADPAVQFAQPNYLYTLVSAPDVAQPLDQYALDLIGLRGAQDLSRGAGVKVGMIDTGVADTHPDLAGSIVDRYDPIGPGGSDDLAHGTAVSSILAAHGRLVGAAPQAQILSARAFSRQPEGDEASSSFLLLGSLDWCAAKDARLVNMSFAGPADPLFSREIAAARSKGILSIAAAGNGGPKAAPAYPGADPAVIAVTAVDDLKRIFSSANTGRYIALAAPGVDILVASPDGGYDTMTGTSMAVAYVTGIAALTLGRLPDLPADNLARLLTDSADDLGVKGRDPVFGAGLVNAQKALDTKSAGAATPETVRIVPANATKP